MINAAIRRFNTELVSQLRLQGVADHAFWMLSPGGAITAWSAGARRVDGYDAGDIMGRPFSCFYTEEEQCADLPQQHLAAALAAGRTDFEGWRVHCDGSRFWARTTIEALWNERHELTGYASWTFDITLQKQQQSVTQHATETLEAALTHMARGIGLYEADERLVFCNRLYLQMIKVDPLAIRPGMTFTDMMRLSIAGGDPGLAPEAIEQRVQQLRRTRLAAASTQDDSLRIMDLVWNDGIIAVNYCPLPGGGWATTLDDVTEQRRNEQRIVHLAQIDPLTELPNRATFLKRLHESLAQRRCCEVAIPPTDDAEADGSEADFDALLYLDLDGFKPVNDALGHPVGDAVLGVVAERIQAQLRKVDTVARLGSDEFAVLMRPCADPKDAASLAQRLISDISRPIQLAGLQIVVGVSIGIALSPPDGDQPDTLLRNAELALCRAKKDGRGCHRFYEAGMGLVMQRRLELERDLRNALLHQEFSLNFQPVINTRTDSISSFEALLRWHSPTRGSVPPIEFIPFAEEIGLMPEIGDWVLRAACLEAVNWPSDVVVSVNLSPTQFRLPDLVERIAAVLEESGLAATRLELEVTETAMIDDIAGAAAILEQLRSRGLQIAVDDFGTGYSSLTFLYKLPFTRIKIDRSFVQDLGNKPEATAIIRAVSGLGASLGVAVTAEGVELQRQQVALAAEGCFEMQGYLFSRPQPASAVQGWIADFAALRGGSATGPDEAETMHGCD